MIEHGMDAASISPKMNLACELCSELCSTGDFCLEFRRPITDFEREASAPPSWCSFGRQCPS